MKAKNTQKNIKSPFQKFPSKRNRIRSTKSSSQHSTALEVGGAGESSSLTPSPRRKSYEVRSIYYLPSGKTRPKTYSTSFHPTSRQEEKTNTNEFFKIASSPKFAQAKIFHNRKSIPPPSLPLACLFFSFLFFFHYGLSAKPHQQVI